MQGSPSFFGLVRWTAPPNLTLIQQYRPVAQWRSVSHLMTGKHHSTGKRRDRLAHPGDSTRIELSERFVREEEIEPEAVVEVEDEEWYDEIIEGDSIDIGEMVSQCLTLELEPYPRKEGIEFELSESDLNPEGVIGPFAELAGLKRNNS